MTTPSSAAAHPAPSTSATSNSIDATESEDPTATGGPRSPINRRQVLVAAGLGASALTLAACGSSATAAASSTSTSTTAPSAAPSSAAAPSAPASAASSAPVTSAGSSSAPSSAAAATSAASSSTAATSSAAPTSASSTAPAANAIVALSKVPVGGAVAAKDASGAEIIVAQPTAGKVVAFSSVCTHQGCTVALAKPTELDCPCHGSKFNALTGAVINGPAAAPLPTVAVKVSGASVVAG